MLKRLFSNFRGAKRIRRDDSPIEVRPKELAKLERILGYTFQDKFLLAQSLTHPSFLLNSRHQILNNQRLEFLGDAVIQLALTEVLYDRFPDYREGKLTKLRSGYARGDYMARIAKRLDLGRFLILKPKDRKAGIAESDSALGDAFEALVGAVYLDSDWETSRTLVLKLYQNLDTAPTGSGEIANPKGTLQEMVQPVYGNNALRYETTGEFGEPHDRTFEITIYCNDRVLGVAKGKAKKEASEKAAIQAIGVLQEEAEE